MVVAGGDDDEAIDAARGEGSDQLLFAGLVLVGTSRKDEDTTLEGDILDFAVERRGEGVGDVFEKHADRGALSVGTAQAAGCVVVPIVEPLDRTHHPRSDRLRDGRFGVDDPGDGLEADTCEGGHLAHGRAAGPAPDLCQR